MSWAFPKIIQRLFADSGASRKLRGDILPFGSTAETACEGNDPRLTKQASTDEVGHVRLNNSVSSTSMTEAATPNAVKTAYDRASSAYNAANSAQSSANSAQSTANAAQSTANSAYSLASNAGGAPTPTSSSGKGQWLRMYCRSLNSFYFPAGGTWACFYLDIVILGGEDNFGAEMVSGASPHVHVEILPGGTIIHRNTKGALGFVGFAWRVA